MQTLLADLIMQAISLILLRLLVLPVKALAAMPVQRLLYFYPSKTSVP
jgi:hypothetical protein